MSLEIIFAEFDNKRGWNQTDLDESHRLDPTYSAVKQYFPEAKLTLYTDIEELGAGYDVIASIVASTTSSIYTKSLVGVSLNNLNLPAL